MLLALLNEFMYVTFSQEMYIIKSADHPLKPKYLGDY